MAANIPPQQTPDTIFNGLTEPINEQLPTSIFPAEQMDQASQLVDIGQPEAGDLLQVEGGDIARTPDRISRAYRRGLAIVTAGGLAAMMLTGDRPVEGVADTPQAGPGCVVASKKTPPKALVINARQTHVFPADGVTSYFHDVWINKANKPMTVTVSLTVPMIKYRQVKRLALKACDMRQEGTELSVLIHGNLPEPKIAPGQSQIVDVKSGKYSLFHKKYPILIP